MRILLTGGSGRLGTELQKLRKFDYVPTRKEMDITNYFSIVEYYLNCKNKPIDLIVHCAAYTQVEKAEKDKKNCYAVNVVGTRNLSLLKLPMLYISTEYIFDGEAGNYKEFDIPYPKNFYSFTKFMGELIVIQGQNCVAVRLLFKPKPFPYPQAFEDQWTSGDYVDVMAKEVNRAIDLFDKLPTILHIGTGRKSIYDLAKQTRDVLPRSRKIAMVDLPRDTSLNTKLWEKIKKDNP